MKLLTKKQVNQRYRDRYVELAKVYDYKQKQWLYEVRRVYRKIHENTTLGQDVGTDLEYRR